jgi:hypothetical protein
VSAGTRTPPAPPVSAPPRGRGRTGWTGDLLMGLRFAVTGGREGWVRTVLTAVGVGFGVAALLLATAIPSALDRRTARETARKDVNFAQEFMPARADTLLVAVTDTRYRGQDVRGRLFQPDGPKAPLPPGTDAYPKPGDMLVSPALKRLLDSGDAELLRERIPYRISGTIAAPGLQEPNELTYYAGSDKLAGMSPVSAELERIDYFGAENNPEGLNPVLMLLVLIMLVVLLMPVAVLIGTAVRFGGERRDRRLAALRLVGADGATVRRIAAGEAAAGALLGLVVGAAVFAGARQLASGIELFGVSVFPADLDPAPALVALVAVLVPASAVAVTVTALRSVVIEPLGVVRSATPRRRKLWWRLLLPLAGAGLLATQAGTKGYFDEFTVVGATVMLLLGITALLPWLVETVVERLGRGPVSWQLAVRRLQLGSGTAARMVNGVAVAVAGAIAVQILFGGVEGDYTDRTGQDLTRAQMSVWAEGEGNMSEIERRVAAVPGVLRTTTYGMVDGGLKSGDVEGSLTVVTGDCEDLRDMADLPSCEDGDAFTVAEGEDMQYLIDKARPGGTLWLSPDSKGPGGNRAWKLPADLRRAEPRTNALGSKHVGVLATRGSLPAGPLAGLDGTVTIAVDDSVRDVRERVRNASGSVGPLTEAEDMWYAEVDPKFKGLQTALNLGTACVLLLIGLSMLVSQLEQLRERKKLLAALVAFGTRRRTLCLSVLWQAALPIGLGLVLALVVGVGMGSGLLLLVGASPLINWASLLTMCGIAAGVVLLVTSLSMPVLLRLLRPDGLRTE